MVTAAAPEFADLASYQRGTDLAAYRAGGHHRVGLKATQGATYVTPDFAGWWRQAPGLGLARVAYHFADGADVGAQAAHFLGAVGPRGPRDRLAVDAEWPDRPTAADGRRIAALIAEIANRGGTPGMVYGSPYWLTAAGLLPAMLPPDWRWLWIAHYGVTEPAVPAGWSRGQILAWQFTDRAPTAGVPAPCDRSRVLREWLTTGDDMPTAAELVDELERRVLAGMRLAETDTVGLASTNPWEILGRTYLKAGDLQDPKMTGLAADFAALRAEIRTLAGGGIVDTGDLMAVVATLPRSDLAALITHCAGLLAGTTTGGT